MPLYVQQLGIKSGPAIVLWSAALVASGLIGLAASGPLWTRLERYFNLRTALIRVLLGFCVAALLMGVATNAWQLLLIRTSHGLLGSAGAIVVVFVTATIPHHGRTRVLGWLQVSMLTGSVLGPLLGGLVVYGLGFDWLFRFAAVAALSMAILSLVILPKLPAKENPGHGVDTEQTPQRSFRLTQLDPRIVSIAIYFVVLQCAAMMTGGLLVLYVQDLGVGLEAAPITGLIFGSSGILAGLAALLAAKRRGRLISALGIGLTGSLAGVLLLAQGLSTALGLVWMFRLGQGFATGIMRPAAQSSLQVLVESGTRGDSFRFVRRASTIGSITGAVLGGLVGAIAGLSAVFTLAGSILILGTIVSAILVRYFGQPSS